MAHHYGWSIREMEDMVPWEFDLYVDMTHEHVRKLREARERK